jgi:hypothetical protein
LFFIDIHINFGIIPLLILRKIELKVSIYRRFNPWEKSAVFAVKDDRLATASATHTIETKKFGDPTFNGFAQ